MPQNNVTELNLQHDDCYVIEKPIDRDLSTHSKETCYENFNLGLYQALKVNSVSKSTQLSASMSY